MIAPAALIHILFQEKWEYIFDLLKTMGEKSKGGYLGTGISNSRIDFYGLAAALVSSEVKVEKPQALSSGLKSAFRSTQDTIVEVIVDGRL